MSQETYAKGEELRRKVLGESHSETPGGAQDTFQAVLQDYVVNNCWGEIWNRPGLDLKTRSFLNLAMLSALVRPPELKLHIRGALNTGITREEIAEVFLHVAMYCGTPSAVEAFKMAREVFREEDQKEAKTHE